MSQQEVKIRETKVIFYKMHPPKEQKCLKPKNMIVSTQEVAPQSPEHLEMETCPTSSEEVNDEKSCNLLKDRPY